MHLQSQDPAFDVAQFALAPGAMELQDRAFRLIVLRLLNLPPFFAKVKDHNTIQSKAGRLDGSKAQAVKNILNSVPPNVKKLLVDYSLEVGFEMTPWSDDSLGSKKWLPGYALLGCLQYPFHFLSMMPGYFSIPAYLDQFVTFNS